MIQILFTGLSTALEFLQEFALPLFYGLLIVLPFATNAFFRSEDHHARESIRAKMAQGLYNIIFYRIEKTPINGDALTLVTFDMAKDTVRKFTFRSISHVEPRMSVAKYMSDLQVKYDKVYMISYESMLQELALRNAMQSFFIFPYTKFQFCDLKHMYFTALGRRVDMLTFGSICREFRIPAMRERLQQYQSILLALMQKTQKSVPDLVPTIRT